MVLDNLPVIGHFFGETDPRELLSDSQLEILQDLERGNFNSVDGRLEIEGEEIKEETLDLAAQEILNEGKRLSRYRKLVEDYGHQPDEVRVRRTFQDNYHSDGLIARLSEITGIEPRRECFTKVCRDRIELTYHTPKTDVKNLGITLENLGIEPLAEDAREAQKELLRMGCIEPQQKLEKITDVELRGRDWQWVFRQMLYAPLQGNKPTWDELIEFIPYVDNKYGVTPDQKTTEVGLGTFLKADWWDEAEVWLEYGEELSENFIEKKYRDFIEGGSPDETDKFAELTGTQPDFERESLQQSLQKKFKSILKYSHHTSIESCIEAWREYAGLDYKEETVQQAYSELTEEGNYGRVPKLMKFTGIVPDHKAKTAQ